MSKRRWIYTILMILCVVLFWYFENFYTPATYSPPENGAKELPFKAAWLPSSTYDAIVMHEHYMLSYSEPHEQAEWVAYTLKKSHLTYDDRERPYFIEDPYVTTKSADWRNYKGSGYDRGHLCPAGDRRFSEYAYNETFYTSNISPQEKYFNAGVWNRLEQKVRQWAKKYKTVSVITGGVLKDTFHEIGEEDVTVPEAFYKVVIREKGQEIKVLAFLIPHEESDQPLKSFLVPLRTIETKTGLDFFYKTSETMDGLETSVSTSGWDF